MYSGSPIPRSRYSALLKNDSASVRHTSAIGTPAARARLISLVQKACAAGSASRCRTVWYSPETSDTYAVPSTELNASWHPVASHQENEIPRTCRPAAVGVNRMFTVHVVSVSGGRQLPRKPPKSEPDGEKPSAAT